MANINVNENIIDRVIEQADRYDIKNMQFEQDILFMIGMNTSALISDAVSKVHVNIDTILKMEQLILSIQKLLDTYNNKFVNILNGKLRKYANDAYKYTGDLIDIGNEVNDRISQSVREQSNKYIYSDETVKVIEEHAFKLLKGHSYTKVNRLRQELIQLVLSGNGNKPNVRKLIENTLSVNKSKAEEIAQTELSTAYNIGTLRRLYEYQQVSGEKVYKYWHGFKYSEVTCDYCRSRIGRVYEIDDNMEELPAHVRCRCVWLPVLQSWNSESARKLITRSNMLNTAYSPEMIYNRIRMRLNIDYADNIDYNAAIDYISGDRSSKVLNAIQLARQEYMSDIVKSLNIQSDTSNTRMSNEFNMQMNFWKNYVASSMADNNKQELKNSYDAIKGVMLLQWNGEQLKKWSDLLSKIDYN